MVLKAKMIRQISAASMQAETYSEVHCPCTVWQFTFFFESITCSGYAWPYWED